MNKEIEFKTPGKRPGAEEATVADDWVAHREVGEGEPTKRFTIDVSQSLHTRIKTQCAMRGSKMADVIRSLLEKEFPEA